MPGTDARRLVLVLFSGHRVPEGLVACHDRAGVVIVAQAQAVVLVGDVAVDQRYRSVLDVAGPVVSILERLLGTLRDVLTRGRNRRGLDEVGVDPNTGGSVVVDDVVTNDR